MENNISYEAGLVIAARSLVQLTGGYDPINSYDPTYYPKQTARMTLFDLKLITGIDYMALYGPEYGYTQNEH